MTLSDDSCYEAVVTHDARFDGAFFVGVSTTGIYCRTVCPAKTPRRDRCTFYPSAAAAEQAGYRPCLRCRPELAPGNARIDSASRLAAAVLSRIEDGALTNQSVEDLAAEMGISDRHLRRVVEAEFGVTPIVLAQTQRLLLAKRLLTDTALTITEVAFASGFSSLRRFNALFQERYRLNPSRLRKTIRVTDIAQETLTCELAYRPPFAWDDLLCHLRGRATCGVECVDDTTYRRTVGYGKHRGWIAVTKSAKKHTLRVEVSASLAPALLPTLSRVKRLFDLAADPQQIDTRLGSLAGAHPGLRVPGAFDGFETAVRAVLGQQISVKAATTIAGRFAAAFGEPIETPFATLTHLPPTAERVARAEPQEIIALGIIAARANTILALAQAIAQGEIDLMPGADVDTTMNRLKALPGIGEWTAQYIAMRALSWPDAFPHTDLGLYKALNETNPKRVLEIAEAWRPWRAYAVMHLWKSLEEKKPS
jgi:AraC family transcriptional regulator of adaptative response / DNA-3-methyladenine glycosylase II